MCHAASSLLCRADPFFIRSAQRCRWLSLAWSGASACVMKRRPVVVMNGASSSMQAHPCASSEEGATNGACKALQSPRKTNKAASAVNVLAIVAAFALLVKDLIIITS